LFIGAADFANTEYFIVADKSNRMFFMKYGNSAFNYESSFPTAATTLRGGTIDYKCLGSISGTDFLLAFDPSTHGEKYTMIDSPTTPSLTLDLHFSSTFGNDPRIAMHIEATNRVFVINEEGVGYFQIYDYTNGAMLVKHDT
jgi:hypothetical protein